MKTTEVGYRKRSNSASASALSVHHGGPGLGVARGVREVYVRGGDKIYSTYVLCDSAQFVIRTLSKQLHLELGRLSLATQEELIRLIMKEKDPSDHQLMINFLDNDCSGVTHSSIRATFSDHDQNIKVILLATK